MKYKLRAAGLEFWSYPLRNENTKDWLQRIADNYTHGDISKIKIVDYEKIDKSFDDIIEAIWGSWRFKLTRYGLMSNN